MSAAWYIWVVDFGKRQVCVMKKIVELKVLENYRLWLRFDDGIEGVVDFSDKPRRGVYTAWNDYDSFRRARVTEAGELAWDRQVDFCPDALWLKVTGKQPQDLDDRKPTPGVYA